MFMFCAADWWSGLDHAAGEEVVRAEVDLNLRMPKEDVELYDPQVMAKRDPPTLGVKLRRVASKSQIKSNMILPGASPGYVQHAQEANTRSEDTSAKTERKIPRATTLGTPLELEKFLQEARTELFVSAPATTSLQKSGATTEPPPNLQEVSTAIQSKYLGTMVPYYPAGISQKAQREKAAGTEPSFSAPATTSPQMSSATTEPPPNFPEGRTEPSLSAPATTSPQMSSATTEPPPNLQEDSSATIQRKWARATTLGTPLELENKSQEVASGSLVLSFRRRDKRAVTVHFTHRPICLRFSKEWPFKIVAIGRDYSGSKAVEVDWTLTHIDDLELKHSHTDAVLLVGRAVQRLPRRPGDARQSN
ncbi:unnamed protein product [Symbiodinium natans]|uniref:Uncharacterized protein n=1 Tax=Symbiodinium natans TaxID=878477 RepID=A0A812HBC3_9DINO|nr:unnamed protein product [Symbiodinium natans]